MLRSDAALAKSAGGRELPICNALWVGPALGPVEAACLASFVEAGHRVDLHVFDEPSGVPSSVRLVDAAETVPREHLIRHRRTGSFSLFSNRFRYALMRAGKGLWIDCDLLCLKPIANAPYIFGIEDMRLINGAVLKLPSDDPVLDDLMEAFTEPRWIPPWANLRRRLRYHLRYRIRPGFGLADMSWGTAGPKALTYYLGRRGLDRFALPQAVFYPVGPYETHLLVGVAAEAVRPRIRPETLCIHLWNQQLASADPAVRGSLVARIVDGSWRKALGVAEPEIDRAGLTAR